MLVPTVERKSRLLAGGCRGGGASSGRHRETRRNTAHTQLHLILAALAQFPPSCILRRRRRERRAMVVGLGRRELAGSLLAVASLPSPLTPASSPTPFGLLPPAVTFGVQIYDDATAERLTLQAHANRTCHAMHTPCHAMHTPCKCLARTVHVPCARTSSSHTCRPSPLASAPSSPARRAATSWASPAPYATQGSNPRLADPRQVCCSHV